MAHFRNDSGVPLSIDRFGLYVPVDGVFDVYDDDADSFRHQSVFTELDPAGDPIAPPAPATDIDSAVTAPGRLDLDTVRFEPAAVDEEPAAEQPTETASTVDDPTPAAEAVDVPVVAPVEAPSTTHTTTAADAPVAE